MERDSFIDLAGEADLPGIARIHIASWQDAYRGVLPSAILASRSREGSLRGWQSTLKKFPGNLTVVGLDHCSPPSFGSTSEVWRMTHLRSKKD
jgi:hypothetical protein